MEKYAAAENSKSKWTKLRGPSAGSGLLLPVHAPCQTSQRQAQTSKQTDGQPASSKLAVRAGRDLARPADEPAIGRLALNRRRRPHADDPASQPSGQPARKRSTKKTRPSATRTSASPFVATARRRTDDPTKPTTARIPIQRRPKDRGTARYNMDRKIPTPQNTPAD